MKMSRRVTTFEIEYYKPSGKLYTSDKFDLEVTWLDSGPYMYDAVDQARSWQAEARLPGLQSGTWDGPIRINHPDGFPVLLL